MSMADGCGCWDNNRKADDESTACWKSALSLRLIRSGPYISSKKGCLFSEIARTRDDSDAIIDDYGGRDPVRLFKQGRVEQARRYAN